jgi:hypothetical protein
MKRQIKAILLVNSILVSVVTGAKAVCLSSSKLVNTQPFCRPSLLAWSLSLVVLLPHGRLGPGGLGNASFYASRGVDQSETEIGRGKWDELPPIERPVYQESIK